MHIIWDLENVPIPSGHDIDVCDFINMLKSWLRRLGYIGDMEVTVVVGKEDRFSRDVIDQLNEEKISGNISYLNVDSAKK